MTGYISPWENNAPTFRADFKNLEQSFSEIDILIMNLFGGSIDEGVPTYNLIKNSKSKTNTIVEGLAASMGSILALAGNNKRAIAKMSRHMVHRARMGKWGDFEDLSDASSTLKDYQDDLVGIIVENSNLEKSWVEKNLMVRGKDTYLTAQKCLEYGFATEIIESNIKTDVPKDILSKKDVKAVFDFYSKQLPEINNLLTSNKTPLKMEKVIEKLGLPKDATQDQVLEAISKLEKSEKPEDTSKVEALTKEIETLKANNAKEKAEALVDGAVSAGKITAAHKENFLKLATNDFESTKAILDGMKAHTPISEQLNGGNGGGSSDPMAGRSFNWLRKNNPQYLEKLKAENKAKYDELFNNRHIAKD